MGKLHIDLLGTSFTIQANDDDEHLEQLLSYYSRVVDRVSLSVGSVRDPLQTSIIAGIMICDEIYKEKNELLAEKSRSASDNSKNSVYDEDITRRTLAMIEKIDKVL